MLEKMTKKKLRYQLEKQRRINAELQKRYDYMHFKYLKKKGVLKSYRNVIQDILDEQQEDEDDDLIPVEVEFEEDCGEKGELIGYS